MSEANMRTPLVWITAPPSGGRSGLGGALVEAFRSIGCLAEEMSFSLLRRSLDERHVGLERDREIVRTFWRGYIDRRPDLLLDFSPIPSDLVDEMRRRGTKTAFWLLEDALDPAYAYWRETVPHYDLFFTFQGAPFQHDGSQRLPWGASETPVLPQRPLEEIVLHGSYSEARGRFLAGFLAFAQPPLPLVVIGPGWDRFNGSLPPHVRVENRRTSPEETARIFSGQIVLIPQQTPINAVAPRVWETIAVGGACVVERCDELERHLTPGVEVASWRTPKEAAVAAHELAANPTRLAAMQRCAAERVTADGLLSHRAATILWKAGIGAS